MRLAGEATTTPAYIKAADATAVETVATGKGEPITSVADKDTISRKTTGAIHPAQLAILSPDIPDTLILRMLPS